LSLFKEDGDPSGPAPSSVEVYDDDDAGPPPLGNTSSQPTLRVAIALVMRAGGRGMQWKPADVMLALRRRGWMPAAKSGPQMVRNRMLEMLDDGELERDDMTSDYVLSKTVWNTGIVRSS
jgi:hypothetical protein